MLAPTFVFTSESSSAFENLSLLRKNGKNPEKTRILIRNKHKIAEVVELPQTSLEKHAAT